MDLSIGSGAAPRPAAAAHPIYPHGPAEYQGKQLFEKRGVPVPEGAHAATVAEAADAAEGLGYPVVIKAEVQIGGRGKAGGTAEAITGAVE